MFIIMDVVFHEDFMYFSSDSKLLEEYHKEIQTIDYDNNISMKGKELLNNEVSELDISGETLEPSSINHPEVEEVIEEEINNKTYPSSPSEQIRFDNNSTNKPHQSLSNEGLLNLEHESSMKRLPHHHNRGVPKTIYEP